MKKSELKVILKYEQNVYRNYSYATIGRRIKGWIKHEYVYQSMKWQKYARLTDYYKERMDNNPKDFLAKLIYLYYIRKRNLLAENIGVEITTANIGKGLLLYHSQGIVINGKSIIGENCHLHGNNCIGNGGEDDKATPIIGSNVIVGIGAKILGGVTIADNIKIAAGAVVVHSFTEPGITIAGVPAKRVK